MKQEDFNASWIRIAELDPEGRIIFTKEYLEIMGKLGWQAKAFAAHLITHWSDEFEHALDYQGEAEHIGNDESIEVVTYWAKHWSQAEWPETLQERMSAE